MYGFNSLKKAFLVTLLVLIVQIVGYVYSNSLALLGDSGHVFSDLLALGASLTALYFASLSPSSRQTFGFHRMEVLAATFNGMLLLIMGVLIVREAYERIETPYIIDSIPLLISAVLGLLGNLYVVYLLHTHKNLNIRSAFLHAVGDVLSSIGVITSGIIIFFTGFRLADVIVSFFIALLIFISAFRVLKKSGAMLLDRAPKELDVGRIKKEVKKIEGVIAVHDVHVWRACSDLVFATLHVKTDAKTLDQALHLKNKVKERLNKMNISHVTVEVEGNERCGEEEGCSVRAKH